MPLIKISNLNKTYPVGKGKFAALKHVDLTVERGEMLAVMGKSGSGKTTLLNVIGTLDSFDSGSYLYNGHNVKKMTDGAKASLRASEIGFVHQDFLLMNRKTAAQNVAFPLYFGKTPYGRIRKLAADALSKTGVLEQADKHVADMSGGQKQRVAIARALVTKPSLILADEPTGALDRATADEIMRLLLDLNRKNGITVIVVTHDTEIADMCGRIVYINDGRLTEE